MADNEHIIIGRHLHRHIDREKVIQEGETTIYQQQWVWSDRLKIKGVIDAVEEKDGIFVPVEYKKGKMSKHLNDHFQLCAAALCLEENRGLTIEYGEIFYHSNRRRQIVEFTLQLRLQTENAIASAHQLVSQKIPLPMENKKKCRDCSLKKICLPQEIKKLITT